MKNNIRNRIDQQVVPRQVILITSIDHRTLKHFGQDHA